MALVLDAPFRPQQAEFVEACQDPAYEIIAAFCGLQSGKTKGGAIACRKLLYNSKVTLPPHLVNKQPMDFWITSKDYRLAMEAVDTFRANTPPEIWLSDSDIRSMGLKRYDQFTWWLAPRRDCRDTLPVRLRARTASDPEGLRATATLGLGWDDEVAHWKEMTWLNMLGRGIVSRPKHIVTTTPKGKNFCYRGIALPGGYKGAPKTDHKISVHWWRSIDNPWANKEFIEKLRLKFGKDYAEQELDGLFTSNVGYVYDFDRSQHMRPIPSQDPAYYQVRVLGVDPGYSDAYAVGVWLKDFEGTWWLADEFYQTRRTTDDLIPWFRSICERWSIQKAFVDKRRPSDFLLLQKAGIPAQVNLDIYAEDDRRTVMPMVRYCQQLFRLGKIVCAPHCEWFAEEAENYAFPARDDMNAGENPVDFRNHHMDAMRYAICSVDDVASGPTIWKRDDRNPNKMVPVGKAIDAKPKPFTAPTVNQTLAAQDEKYEEMERARNG
jgi:proteasome lid subunit RPN8/RPN11